MYPPIVLLVTLLVSTSVGAPASPTKQTLVSTSVAAPASPTRQTLVSTSVGAPASPTKQTLVSTSVAAPASPTKQTLVSTSVVAPASPTRQTLKLDRGQEIMRDVMSKITPCGENSKLDESAALCIVRDYNKKATELGDLLHCNTEQMNQEKYSTCRDLEMIKAISAKVQSQLCMLSDIDCAQPEDIARECLHRTYPLVKEVYSQTYTPSGTVDSTTEWFEEFLTPQCRVWAQEKLIRN